MESANRHVGGRFLDRILVGTLLLILLVLIGVQASRATVSPARAGQDVAEPASAFGR